MLQRSHALPAHSFSQATAILVVVAGFRLRHPVAARLHRESGKWHFFAEL
jgi:hypothetical protein